MKKYILAILFILPCILLHAQDVIIKKNGDEIKAKVKSVTDSEIEYNKFDFLDGPTYKVLKSDILVIMYSNGTKDIFTSETKAESSTSKSNQPVAREQQRYYNYDFFDKNIPVVFLGIDFTKCKVIAETIDNPVVTFTEINTLFIKEDNKYNMKGAIRRSKLITQLELVNKLNQDITINAITENPNENISFSDLQNSIDGYDLTSIGLTDGIAMVMICDNLNKLRKNGAFYYVAFDIKSKKILFSDRLVGGASGNGLRNYYAHTVYETITEVQDKKFGQWKAMYRK